MSGDLYISASGALARLRELEVVANNLANADTPGFKRDAVVFESTLASALQHPEGDPIPGAPGSAYVDTTHIATDYGAGSVAMTGAPLDVAIAGPGFFEVETPEGPRYTRAGSFIIAPGGQITTPDGHPVQGQGGPISAGSRPVEIRASGEVVDALGDVLGRLRVVDFEEPEGLMKAGGNLFLAPPEADPLPVADPELLPRSVERSNVVPIKELAQLVILQRAFEISMQAMQTDDQTTEQLLQEFLS